MNNPYVFSLWSYDDEITLFGERYPISKKQPHQRTEQQNNAREQSRHAWPIMPYLQAIARLLQDALGAGPRACGTGESASITKEIPQFREERSIGATQVAGKKQSLIETITIPIAK